MRVNGEILKIVYRLWPDITGHYRPLALTLTVNFFLDFGTSNLTPPVPRPELAAGDVDPPPLPSAGCWACQIVCLCCLWQLSSPPLCRQSLQITVFLLHFPSKSLQKSMSEITFKNHYQKCRTNCKKLPKMEVKIESKSMKKWCRQPSRKTLQMLTAFFWFVCFFLQKVDSHRTL